MKKSKVGLWIVGVAVFLLLIVLKDHERSTPQSSQSKREATVTEVQREFIPNAPWPPVMEGQLEGMEAQPTLTNYYVIFDASGSMNEFVVQNQTKIEAGKSALVTFAQSVPEEANLGLLSFEPVAELLPLGRGNREQFVGAVGDITAKGRTPLVESLFLGYKVLTKQAARQSGYGRYILVVVTDGASSDGNPGGIAREIVGKTPIEIQTIGFGVTDHALNLPGITQYVTARSPQALINALNQVIASEADTFVDPVEFRK